MNTKENYTRWSKEEEALLTLYPLSELPHHPLMVANGRHYNAIRKKLIREGIQAVCPANLRKTKPERSAKAHAMKGRPYTQEQKDLLFCPKYTNQEIAAVPLFKDRTYEAIQTYRQKFKPTPEYEAPKVRIRVKEQPQPLKLYQFITIAEATPARAKEWQKEERRANR